MATDITDRKRIEEALHARHSPCRSPTRRTLYRQLVEYLATILGVDGAFIAVPDPHDPFRMTMLACCLDGEVVENFDYSLRHTPCETVMGKEFQLYPERLGELFPLDQQFRALNIESYAGYPLNDANGRALGLVGAVSRGPLSQPAFIESVLLIFAVRVSAELERAAAQQALRASEANYREIFEASDDSIFVRDWGTGALLDVNRRACEIYGYSRDELLAIDVDTISQGVPPYTEADADAWLEVVRRDGHARYEWRRRNRDGSLHWDEVLLKCVTIGGQRRVLSIARDITERKVAEEGLRASEEQYRAVFNASTDALILWNSRSERVDVNPAYELMYGYGRDEVLAGVRTRELPAEHRERQARIIALSLTGEGFHGEFETQRRNGERFAIELRTVPIRYHGEPHVLAIIHDLTQRRAAERRREELESRLRQAQKMEAIGQLTGGIAHDFNNLLTTIMGYVTLAGEREVAHADAKLGGYLGQASRACERARDLIQQMLMFSRGQRGSPRVFALGTMVQDAMPALRLTWRRTVTIDVCIDPAPAIVRIDPVQLEQVLFNLCSTPAMRSAAPARIAVEVRRGNVESRSVCQLPRGARRGLRRTPRCG